MQANDMKAMREALVGLIDGICFHCDMSGDCKGVPCEKMQKAKAALAATPRNCDVGTAEEQAKRLREFCKKHRDGVRRCSRCPVERIFPKDCTLAWTQLPYEEGGAR